MIIRSCTIGPSRWLSKLILESKLGVLLYQYDVHMYVYGVVSVVDASATAEEEVLGPSPGSGMESGIVPGLYQITAP